MAGFLFLGALLAKDRPRSRRRKRPKAHYARSNRLIVATFQNFAPELLANSSLRVISLLYFLGLQIMALDPRRLAALRMQLDALAHEVKSAGNPDVHAAFDEAHKALFQLSELLERRNIFFQVPKDYKPPKGTGGCKDSK
jgi:hypothetical protein